MKPGVDIVTLTVDDFDRALAPVSIRTDTFLSRFRAGSAGPAARRTRSVMGIETGKGAERKLARAEKEDIMDPRIHVITLAVDNLGTSARLLSSRASASIPPAWSPLSLRDTRQARCGRGRSPRLGSTAALIASLHLSPRTLPRSASAARTLEEWGVQHRTHRLRAGNCRCAPRAGGSG